MEQNTEKVTETGIAKRMKNLKPAWKEGDPSPNPDGRPKGQRNYATIRAEAIKAIAIQNGKTPDQIEEMLLSKGMAEALKGDFRFYKDDLDRIHGQSKQPLEHSGNIKVVTMSEEQKDALLSLLNTK